MCLLNKFIMFCLQFSRLQVKSIFIHALHLLIFTRLNQGLAIKVLVFMLQNLQIFLKVLLHLLEKRQLSWKISHLILSFQMILQKRCVLVIFQCNWMANCFKMHMMMSGILYMSIKNIIKIDCFGNVKRI